MATIFKLSETGFPPRAKSTYQRSAKSPPGTYKIRSRNLI